MTIAHRERNGKIRITGGLWKRSRLTVPDSPGLRPTPDRVRETLFNWLGQDLSGWRCLDAFAGTGVLGLEAASRGAAEVLMLEVNAMPLRRLREALQRLKAEQVSVQRTDALVWMVRNEGSHFDLVFLDPPFGVKIYDVVLAAAVRLLAPGGLVYLEAPSAVPNEVLAAYGLRLHRRGHAGTVYFQLLQQCSGPMGDS